MVNNRVNEGKSNANWMIEEIFMESISKLLRFVVEQEVKKVEASQGGSNNFRFLKSFSDSFPSFPSIFETKSIFFCTIFFAELIINYY